MRMVHSAQLGMEALRKKCDGSHEHDTFAATRGSGGAAGAEEKSYPQLFCQRLAKIAADALGVSPCEPAVADDVKAAAGRQPRRTAAH